MVSRALDNGLMKRSQGTFPNEVQGPTSARAQAVRALAVVEEYVSRAGDAIEQDLAEKDVLSVLSALRRQVTALQMRLVKARLEHFQGSADARRPARATEVLDLLESRSETNLQDVEAEGDRDQILPRCVSHTALEQEEE